MKKFFKMKNLLFFVNYFNSSEFVRKIFGKLKKQIFLETFKIVQNLQFNKKISIVVLIYILEKKMQIFRHGFGVISTFWKEVLKKNYFNQKL